MKEEVITKKKKYLTIVLVLVLVGTIMILGGSYAFFTVQYEGTKEQTITAAHFEVVFESSSNSIQLTNTYPMTEVEGKALDPFVFSVTNKGDVPAYYKIVVILDDTNTLDSSLLKYTLKKNDEEESTPVFLANLEIATHVVLAADSTDSYEFKLWLDESATNDAMNKVWQGKIELVAEETDS